MARQPLKTRGLRGVAGECGGRTPGRTEPRCRWLARAVSDWARIPVTVKTEPPQRPPQGPRALDKIDGQETGVGFAPLPSRLERGNGETLGTAWADPDPREPRAHPTTAVADLVSVRPVPTHRVQALPMTLTPRPRRCHSRFPSLKPLSSSILRAVPRPGPPSTPATAGTRARTWPSPGRSSSLVIRASKPSRRQGPGPGDDRENGEIGAIPPTICPRDSDLADQPWPRRRRLSLT